jgi:high affinity Mn2+ porin
MLPYLFVSDVVSQSNLYRVGVNYLFGDEDRARRSASLRGVEEFYSFHVLETNVLQGYPSFSARYSGANSFPPRGELRDGSTTDVFAGIRLWEGAAVYVNPETNGGFALGQGNGNVTGAASYPNASFTRGTSGSPYLRFMRYFLRQTIGLGGGDDAGSSSEGAHSVQLEAGAGQIARRVDRNRITLQVGKYAVNDTFGTNAYASDPTHDFLNFNFSNALGSFDYASDVWGYTYGAAVQWRQDWWTGRARVCSNCRGRREALKSNPFPAASACWWPRVRLATKSWETPESSRFLVMTTLGTWRTFPRSIVSPI